MLGTDMAAIGKKSEARSPGRGEKDEATKREQVLPSWSSANTIVRQSYEATCGFGLSVQN